MYISSFDQRKHLYISQFLADHQNEQMGIDSPPQPEHMPSLKALCPCVPPELVPDTMFAQTKPILEVPLCWKGVKGPIIIQCYQTKCAQN